jgi:phage terminase large subunit-like protein
VTGDALALMSALVLETGHRWGEVAAPFQMADARALLDLSGPRRHYLTRPRGASKTTDLGGVAIAVLLEQAPRQSRSYGFAADRDQSGLLVDAIAGFADRTPEIGTMLKIDSYQVSNQRTGATLQIMASDDASAWGLRPYFVVVDEFGQWKTTPGPRRLWHAAYSALPKVTGSRLAILTSAGDPAHWSYGVLQRALGRPTRWRVSETPGPCPWLDPEELEEQRHELPEWEYARLHLNQWTASDDRVASLDDIRACAVLDGPLAPDGRWQYVVAVDLSSRRDTTVVAVCHAEPVLREGSTAAHRIVLDRMETWTPRRGAPVVLSEVEAAIHHAAVSFGAVVVCDPWQALSMIERLRHRGCVIDEFTFSAQSVGRLASTLHVLLRERQLAIPDDPELINELANVRLKETAPGVVRLDHDHDKHDDRAVTLAMAATWLLNLPPPVPNVLIEDEDLFPELRGFSISPY